MQKCYRTFRGKREPYKSENYLEKKYVLYIQPRTPSKLRRACVRACVCVVYCNFITSTPFLMNGDHCSPEQKEKKNIPESVRQREVDVCVHMQPYEHM